VDWLSINQRKHCAPAEGKYIVKIFDSDIQKLILQFTFNIYIYIYIYIRICIYSTICSALTSGRRAVDDA